MKGQTLLIGTNGVRKLNEGNLLFAIQANRVDNTGIDYKIETNMDWSFDKATTAPEIISMIATFLKNLEEVFGERLVTECIAQYGEDTGKTVLDKENKIMYFKGRK